MKYLQITPNLVTIFAFDGVGFSFFYSVYFALWLLLDGERSEPLVILSTHHSAILLLHSVIWLKIGIVFAIIYLL